jgi:diguanylate cyclase (GGDEF)-like protein
MDPRLFDFFNRISKPGLILISLTMIVLIGFFTYWIPRELYIFVLYLIPIVLGAWFVGRWAGVFMSVLGALAWLAADLLPSNGNRHPWISFWNMIAILSIFIIIAYILTVLKKALPHEKESDQIDYLTGVANRRLFFELANAELNKAHRYRRPITLVYLDLDNFKTINDTMGHDTGDRVLLLVAHTTKMNIRVSDTITRLGGDEFAIMLPETGATAAAIVVDKVFKSLDKIIRRNKWPVTFSCGVLTFVSPPLSVDLMVYKADQLMREAKQAGKNQIKYKSEQ